MEETLYGSHRSSHVTDDIEDNSSVDKFSDQSIFNSGDDTTEPNLNTYDWLSILDQLSLDKHPANFIETDLLNRELPELEMWQTFVTFDSRAVGFGVHLHHSSSNQHRGTWRPEWVCSHQGFRRRKFSCVAATPRWPRDATRCGCQASFHVLKNLSGEGWRVKKFVTEHNHNLTTPEHLYFLRSNRKVTNSQASQMRDYMSAGLRTCDIVNLMVHQSGGFERLGFTRKDAYNKEQAIHRAKIVETDAEGLLGYLTSKIDSTDPTLFVKYAIDDSNRLGHIFWADSIAQRDYMCFNNAAIVKCFPFAVYRLCGWHLSTNVATNIKLPHFTKAFSNLLYKHYNIPT
ncbi:hypothetical protein UlMin_031064 [Ulmus minor]